MTTYASVSPESSTKDMPFAFTGTQPLLPFDRERFYGLVQVDGQTPRVASIVCFDGLVIQLTLVGYDTSVSAAFARLWGTKGIPYLPPADVSWNGPTVINRKTGHYKQFQNKLPGTKEMVMTGLFEAGNIGWGLHDPKDITADPVSDNSALVRSAVMKAQRAEMESRARFVFGNCHEETPDMRAFQGTLAAIKVIFLHADAEHPEWPRVWAERLWQRALAKSLIVPCVAALGIKAWKVGGSTSAWSKLIGEGLKEGWLPYRDTTPMNEEGEDVKKEGEGTSGVRPLLDESVLVHSYTVDEAISDGGLCEVFKSRWAELSGGKRIVATDNILDEFSLAAIREMWNEFVVWNRDVKHTLRSADQMFVTEMNHQKVWILEDDAVFTILFPSDY